MKTIFKSILDRRGHKTETGIVSEIFRMRDFCTSPSIPCLNIYNQMRDLNVGLINKCVILF